MSQSSRRRLPHRKLPRKKLFDSLRFAPGQLLTEPDHARPHQRIAFRTSRKHIFLAVLVIVSLEFAARTARDKNVAVNLYHLLVRQSRARVQVVHVLRNEKEIGGVSR